MLKKNYFFIIIFIIAPFFSWSQEVVSENSENFITQDTTQVNLTGLTIFDQSKFYIENKVFVKEAEFRYDPIVIKTAPKVVARTIEKPVSGIVFEEPILIQIEREKIRKDSIYTASLLIKPLPLKEIKRQLEEKRAAKVVASYSNNYSQGGSGIVANGFYFGGYLDGNLPPLSTPYFKAEEKKYGTGSIYIGNTVCFKRIKKHKNEQSGIIYNSAAYTTAFSYYHSSRPPPSLT